MMLYVDQVAAYLTRLMDEDEPTFLNAADIQRYLEIGYDEFRARVSDLDSSIFSRVVDLVYAASDRYDLASGVNPVRIMGAPPITHERFSRIISVRETDGTATAMGSEVRSANSLDDLLALDPYEFRYLLTGTELRVSAQSYSGTLRLTYLPVGKADWSKQTAGNLEWIDDLVEYHDIIALLAYQQYAIEDGFQSPEVDNLLVRRWDALTKYIAARTPKGGTVRRAW